METGKWKKNGKTEQECVKKIFRTASAIVFMAIFPIMVSAQGQQTPQDIPVEPVKGKTGAFERIEKAVFTVQAVTSQFRQERRLAMLRDPVITTGRFYYEKPDKLRWESISPDASGFLVNGKIAKQWKGKDGRPDVFDLQKNPVMQLIVDQILAWTKADFAWIEKRYTVSVAKENPIALKLVPRSSQERKYVDYIRISFEAETHYANAVEIIEKGGDATYITFSDMVINNSPQRELFE